MPEPELSFDASSDNPQKFMGDWVGDPDAQVQLELLQKKMDEIWNDNSLTFDQIHEKVAPLEQQALLLDPNWNKNQHMSVNS